MSRITVAKVVGYSVAAIAAATSYGHQVELLQRAGLDPLFGVVPSEWVTPTTVDSLAIIAMIIRTAPTATAAMKRAALLPLILAGGLSVAANVAIARNLVQVIVGVWTVLAYILAEVFVSRLSGKEAAAPDPFSTAPIPVPAPTLTPSVAPVTTPPSPIKAAAPAQPAPQPVTTPPAPLPAPTIPTPRVMPPQRPTPKPTAPPRPSTDNHVTASGSGRRESTTESGLLRRARHAAEGHRRDTGARITKEELAAKLRIREGLAQQLMTALETSTSPRQDPAPALAR